MDTTLTIKLPKKLRDDARKTAGRLGVPLTTVVNSSLKQFVRDQRLVLEAECQFPSHTPNAETRSAIQETRAALRTGKGLVSMTVEEFGEYLRSI